MVRALCADQQQMNPSGNKTAKHHPAQAGIQLF